MKLENLGRTILLAGALVVAAGCASQRALRTPPALPPRPEGVEATTASPDPRYAWVPGHWEWRGHWVWVPGRWVVPPHLYAMWVPGHWVRRPNGFVWVRGRWN